MGPQRRRFKYHPLPKSHSFRLIKGIASDATGSHLSCVLKSFSLDDYPSYRCLSYTWGPALMRHPESGEHTDTTRFELTVRAKKAVGVLPIRENLFDALCQLSSSSLGSPLYMWIDAICIDQDNLEERSSQVSMMGTIYSGAEKVIVWLGKDMADFSDFAWFHSDALASEYLQGSQTDSISKRLRGEAPIFQGGNDFEPELSEKLHAYCRFFEQRRWFNRAWVVQEIVLARSSDIEVWCGNERLSWTNMVAFALGACFSRRGLASSLQAMGKSIKHRIIGVEVLRLGLLQEWCERGGPDQESNDDLKMLIRDVYGVTDSEGRRHAFLQHVLRFLRPMDSYDPRDKVYAAVGIVNRFSPKGSRSFIYPEYETPVREVYEYTAKFLLENLPYLSVLTLVEDPSRRKIVNLPSWVPDFSSQQTVPLLQKRRPMPYNASAGQSPSRSWFLKDSILRLRAGCHDTVAEVGISMSTTGEEPPVSWSKFLLKTLEFIDDALRLCSTLDPTYINGQSRIQALGTTMMAGRAFSRADILHLRCWLLWHLVEASESGIEGVTDMLESIVYRMAVLNRSTLSEEDFLAVPQDLAHYAIQDVAKPEQRSVELNATVEEITENCDMFSRKFSSVYPYRRLYTTSKGYIGFGPMSTQVGDEVWIICDARTPFVLHPQPENSNVPKAVKQFQLVGETYLDGFMDGEALKSGLVDQLRWVDLI